MEPFPQTVYVVREEAGDDSYLLLWEDLDSIDAATIVGIYTLTDTKALRIARVLE